MIKKVRSFWERTEKCLPIVLQHNSHQEIKGNTFAKVFPLVGYRIRCAAILLCHTMGRFVKRLCAIDRVDRYGMVSATKKSCASKGRTIGYMRITYSASTALGRRMSNSVFNWMQLISQPVL